MCMYMCIYVNYVHATARTECIACVNAAHVCMYVCMHVYIMCCPQLEMNACVCIHGAQVSSSMYVLKCMLHKSIPHTSPAHFWPQLFAYPAPDQTLGQLRVLYQAPVQPVEGSFIISGLHGTLQPCQRSGSALWSMYVTEMSEITPIFWCITVTVTVSENLIKLSVCLYH